MVMQLAAIFGIALFLIAFYSDNLYIKRKTYRERAKSFAAGVSVTYIFLSLLPEAFPEEGEKIIFFAFVLLGFVKIY